VYRLELTRPARKALDSLPRTIQPRVEAAIAALATRPRPSGSAKLKGEDNLWRIRVGDYRVIYEIRDEVLVVIIVRVAHRRDAYR